ncbi:site-specific integrase [Kovacikia minuta CCNUW1]|uniref:tyrosine-type recombinase/integrase n=1 Tax=Kovacikia minuta TaxID=2931930 RepID=UPI001CCDCCA6|nr:site-specific integrase [Kovacikia minuta]UBF26408.1 site-specific integrase [Kovacikia minuta CCNUW1]
MPKVNGKGQAAILSNDQIDQVIKLCREPYNLAVAIAAYTGCRMGEAIQLRAENLDLAAGIITLTHTKTGRTREVVMHPELVVILADAELPTCGYLFPSPRTSGHITRQAVDKELREVCEALEIRGVGTHSFRRSLATNLHGKGIPLKTIASITGHESLNELSRYLDVTPEQQKAAILAR